GGGAVGEGGAGPRKAGTGAPILLPPQPRPADVGAVVRYDLRVCVHSVASADLLATAAREQGKVVRVHLKVDTGMHRVGVAPADALGVAREIEGRPELELEGVFTHCAV